MVENTVEKGENAGYQHFLLFPHCFLKASSSELLKVGIVWYVEEFVYAYHSKEERKFEEIF